MIQDRRRRSVSTIPHSPDTGTALPLVLAITVVLSLVVVAIARFGMSSLAYGRIAEDRSDRLTAADAGLRYAVDQVKVGNAQCLFNPTPVVLPQVNNQFNGATATVECDVIGGGFDLISLWAAVVTGEGLTAAQQLITTQAGSNQKILEGPVWMSRVDSAAFGLAPSAGVTVKNGPLVHHNGSTPCVAAAKTSLPSNFVFEPDLIFGPLCSQQPWYEREAFQSPPVPETLHAGAGGMVLRDGTVSESGTPPWNAGIGVVGSYYQTVDPPGPIQACRVFRPGHYVRPPNVDGVDVYFESGDYFFDFKQPTSPLSSPPVFSDLLAATAPNSKVFLKDGVATAGVLDTVFDPSKREIANPGCDGVVTDSTGETGVTFYMAGKAHIEVAAGGSLEIMPRLQTDPAGVIRDQYVSIQALCDFDASSGPATMWCSNSNGNRDGNLAVSNESTLVAPASNSGPSPANPSVLFTLSGNGKEVVSHGLIYAPLAQMEFGNVSSTAVQKMLGGLVLARLVLQSSTSASNFEISVSSTPIDGDLLMTATAVKDGETTRIQAVVEYRPEETIPDDRVRVNSWRVCDVAGC